MSDIDLGYTYFPTTTGSYVIFKVDSTYYGVNQEHYVYQIKEEIVDQFIDDAGRPAQILNRYYRPGNGSPWTLIDVWTILRTPTTAERVEENVRYVKLEFPVKEGGTWNGNAFNNQPAWQYVYQNVNKFADVGILQFDNTLTVQQWNNVNLVDQEVFYEIYAKDIGLVYKQKKDLNVQSNQTSGYDVTYSAIAYSMN